MSGVILRVHAAGDSFGLRDIRKDRPSVILTGDIDAVREVATEFLGKDIRLSHADADLSDPNVVHLNMLRGAIARPSWAQIEELYPEHMSHLHLRTEEIIRNAVAKRERDAILAGLKAAADEVADLRDFTDGTANALFVLSEARQRILDLIAVKLAE